MINNFVWNKESENSIYDAICDWDYHTFACIMTDGCLVRFSGMWDENCEGERFLHIEDDLDTYEPSDIVMWIEIPEIK